LTQPGTKVGYPRDWMFYVPPVLAFAFFLVYLAQIHSQPFFRYLVANPLIYDGEARQLLAGTPSGHPFFLSALYPSFVALVYGLSGQSQVALAVAQGLLMAAGVWLVSKIAGRLLSPWAALGASLGMAFYWSFYYFAGEMVPAVLFVALMLAGLHLFFERGQMPSRMRLAAVAFVLAAALMYAAPALRHFGSLVGGKVLPQPARHYWAGLAFFAVLAAGGLLSTFGLSRWKRLAGLQNLAAAGFALGASALAWSGALILAAVLAIGLALKRGRSTGVAVLATAFLLPVVASFTHNYILSGDLIPITSSFGVNLFIGNNQTSDGMDPFRFGAGNEVRIEADRLGLSGKQRSDFFTRKAIESIRARPARWLGLEARKTLIWLSRVQVNNNADIAERRATWRKLFVPRLHFGIVFPLACAGMVAAFLENRRALWLVAAYLSLLAVPLVFFACERFRLPAVVLLVMLAALGAETLVRRARARQAKTLALALAAVAAGALVSNVDFPGISGRQMPSIVANRSYVERLAGHDAEARRLAIYALELDPGTASAYMQLGALEEKAGDNLAALTHYLDCLERNPFFVAAYDGAARILDAERINRAYLDAYVDGLLRGKPGDRKADLIDFIKRRRP
jgi:hypothetical protein